MVNAKEERYELVMADRYPVLFTNARINRDSVPKGLYCYDIRHDDECQGIACEIKKFVLVNHWGTILSKAEIPMPDGYLILENDIEYLGVQMDVDEYIKGNMTQYLSEDECEMSEFFSAVSEIAIKKGFETEVKGDGLLYLNLNGKFVAVLDESGTMSYHPYDEIFEIMDEVNQLRKSISAKKIEEGIQMNM